MQCSQCGRDFNREDMTGPVASISGSILGDECIESYYYCDCCGVYTVQVFWDLFSGEESSSLHGPILKAKGDAAVALIRQCSMPWNKKCRCSAHLLYFKDSALD